MTTEQIRARLIKCQEDEDKLYKEITYLDWVIKSYIRKKERLAKKISKNMNYRNSLITKL